MAERYNKSPIALSEGKIFIDGVEVCHGVKFKLDFNPKVWTGKELGERLDSSRWIGGTITGSITHRVSTPWLEEKIQEYLETGITPELTITGIMDDKGSDYYREFGSKTITALGCVLTGGITLMDLDASSDGVREDTVAFNAKAIV